MKRKKVARKTGVATVEFFVATAVLGLLVVLASNAFLSYGRTNEEYIWRRAASWAAHAQVQRCQAGAVLDTPPPDGLVAEEISLRTESEPGQGTWKGMNLITVTATATLPNGRIVHEKARGYAWIGGGR